MARGPGLGAGRPRPPAERKARPPPALRRPRRRQRPHHHFFGVVVLSGDDDRLGGDRRRSCCDSDGDSNSSSSASEVRPGQVALPDVGGGVRGILRGARSAGRAIWGDLCGLREPRARGSFSRRPRALRLIQAADDPRTGDHGQVRRPLPEPRGPRRRRAVLAPTRRLRPRLPDDHRLAQDPPPLHRPLPRLLPRPRRLRHTPRTPLRRPPHAPRREESPCFFFWLIRRPEPPPARGRRRRETTPTRGGRRVVGCRWDTAATKETGQRTTRRRDLPRRRRASPEGPAVRAVLPRGADLSERGAHPRRGPRPTTPDRAHALPPAAPRRRLPGGGTTTTTTSGRRRLRVLRPIPPGNDDDDDEGLRSFANAGGDGGGRRRDRRGRHADGGPPGF
mmetsp:Transcript_38030/g.122083  ORF Transcript_38030/g.122083 Transcript_38030/m.122083 type:complete len:392 (+) Transcript_38030:1107-2282(+)